MKKITAALLLILCLSGTAIAVEPDIQSVEKYLEDSGAYSSSDLSALDFYSIYRETEAFYRKQAGQTISAEKVKEFLAERWSDPAQLRLAMNVLLVIMVANLVDIPIQKPEPATCPENCDCKE